MESRLGILIEHLGLNQKEFAEQIGLTAGNITEWRKGRSAPTAKILKVLAEKYGISLNWLLTGTGSMLLTDTPAPDLPAEDAALLADVKQLIAKYPPKTVKLPNHAAPSERPPESLAKDKPLDIIDNNVSKGVLLTDLHKVYANRMQGNVAAGFGGDGSDIIEGVISADQVLGRTGQDVYCFKVVGDSMIYSGIYPGDLVMVVLEKPRLGSMVLARTADGLTVKRYAKDNQGRFILHPDNYHYPDILIDPTVEIIGVVTTVVKVFVEG